MIKTNRIITTLSLLALVTTATHADMDIRGERTSFYERNKPKPIGFNYTYLDVAYFNRQYDDSGNTSVRGLGVGLSFEGTKNLSFTLDIGGGALDSVYSTDNIEALETIFGINYHQPLSALTDVFVAAQSINSALTNSTTNATVNNSGYVLTFGLRRRIDAKMEWGASLAHTNIGDVSNNLFRVDYSYGADSETQYIIGYESSNAVNKPKTLTLGIRLNY